MAGGTSQYSPATCELCLAFSASLSNSPSIVCGAGEGRLTGAVFDPSSKPPSPSVVLLCSSGATPPPVLAEKVLLVPAPADFIPSTEWMTRLWRMFLSEPRASSYSRDNRRCILCWRNSEALMLCLQSHLQISATHFLVILSLFTGILGSYTASRSKHQPAMLFRQGASGQGEIRGEKDTGAPETKGDGQASLAARRRGFKGELISLMCWFPPGYTPHLTQTSTDKGSLNGNSELCGWDTGVGEVWQCEGGWCIHRASAPLEPGCVDMVLLLPLPPFKGDQRQCFPDSNIVH